MTSKLPMELVLLPAGVISQLERIPGVYINLREEQRSGSSVSAFGDGSFVDEPVYQFLKNKVVPPVKVALLFQGYGKQVGAAVIELQSVYWDASDYPRLDFDHPPELSRIHGCPNFWGAFILAIAKVPQDTKVFAAADDDFQKFIELAKASAMP